MPTLVEAPPPVRKATLTEQQSRNLTGSLGKNTLFGIVSSVAQVLTRLVTVPMIIAHLGLGGFGIWSIILVTATYMRFGTVGIRSAFQKYVAEATGNGDYETASRLLSTGTAAIFILSVAGLIPVAFFARAIAIASGVPPEFLHASTLAISMLALIMVVSNSGAAFEAIVAGGHRIDLIRKATTIFSVLEAIGLVSCLHYGLGLFSMAVVMVLSETAFIIFCYLECHRVVPEIHVRWRYVSKSVAPELLRFAGSYQLLSTLQMVYGAIVPIAVLRGYGADAAGVLGIATRLTSPVAMCLYAFLVPILSGSAMVYATGSTEQMARLLAQATKITLAMTIVPLGLVCAFGSNLILAWTGQSNSHFALAICLVSLGMLFQGFGLLGLVFYRSTGKAVMDNLRELVKITILAVTAVFSRRLGFYGLLAGMAAAEFVGMIVMLIALGNTFRVFDVKSMLRNTWKLSVATGAMVVVGLLCTFFPAHYVANARMLATVRVGLVGLAILICSYPILLITGAFTKPEVAALLRAFKTKQPEMSIAPPDCAVEFAD